MEEGIRSPSLSRSASSEQAPVDQGRHEVKVEFLAFESTACNIIGEGALASMSLFVNKSRADRAQSVFRTARGDGAGVLCTIELGVLVVAMRPAHIHHFSIIAPSEICPWVVV